MKKHNLIFTAMIMLGLVTLACNVLSTPQRPGPGQESATPDPVLLDQTATVPGGGGSAEVAFEASSGQRIQILLSAANPSVQPYASLQSPDGTSVYNPPINTAANGANQVEIAIDQTGQYTLTLFDGSNQGGTVAVKVIVLPAQGTSQSRQLGQPTQPGQADPTAAAQPGLFELVQSVDVTPTDNLVGGMFVRIGYISGSDRIGVAFQARLAQKDKCKSGWGYAYSEYTTDMVPTGKSGVLNCYAWSDSGGMFEGNDLYVVNMGPSNMGPDGGTDEPGWWLAKYDAVTWKESVSPFHFPVTGPGKEVADPMVALVNGQIDIASVYRQDLTEPGGPHKGFASHHQLFTPDLQFVEEQILSDIPHIGALSSELALNDITNYLTSTALLGDIVVMQYSPDWKYLGSQVVMPGSSCPEGLAFDGTRFYVAYLDNMGCTDMPCYQNIRLAAFDSNWNLLDDVAVTNYVSQDHKQANRPTLALRNGRVYVAWDQNENEVWAQVDVHDADVQVHVRVYEVTAAGR